VKTHPAEAAKEARPYHTMKVIATRKCSDCLEIVCFVAPAGAVSQNLKDNHGEYSEEDDNNQHFDGNKQKAAQGDDGTQQGYYEQY
jgi:hypothetical protein